MFHVQTQCKASKRKVSAGDLIYVGYMDMDIYIYIFVDIWIYD
jgi:hypothetical protein